MSEATEERWRNKKIEDEFAKIIFPDSQRRNKSSALFQLEAQLQDTIYSTYTNEQLTYFFQEILPNLNVKGRISFFESTGKNNPRIYKLDLFKDGVFQPLEWEKYHFRSGKSYQEIFSELGIEYNQGIQLVTLVFILKLKKHFLNLNLSQIYRLDITNEYTLNLVNRAKQRVLKNSLPIDSLIIRSLISPALEAMADLILQEEFVDGVLFASKNKYIEPFRFLLRTFEFRNILEVRSQNNNVAKNPYGSLGPNTDFDIRFREVLLQVTYKFYDYISNRILDNELITFINQKMEQILENYSYINEKKGSDNRKFADVLLNFFRKVLTNEFDGFKNLYPDEQDKEVIHYLAALLESLMTRQKKHSVAYRRSFIEHYYYSLKSGDSRIYGQGFVPGTASFYRDKLLAILILKHPNLAKEIGFRLDIKAFQNKIRVDISHSNFRGFTLDFSFDYLTKISKENNIPSGVKSYKVLSMNLQIIKLKYFKYNNNMLNTNMRRDAAVRKNVEQELYRIIKICLSVNSQTYAIEAIYLLSVLKGEIITIDNFEP